MLKSSVYTTYFRSFYYLCFTNVLRSNKLQKCQRKAYWNINTHQKRYGNSSMGGDEAPQEG